MSIRRILLLSFLAVSLIPTAVLTQLAFVQARGALQEEIGGHLQAHAATAMEHIDWMLFERMENVRTWRQLEVLQDIRLHDVDKRVSRVLADLKAGHDVYDLIFCTTSDGQIVAASDPNAIGQQQPSTKPWLTVDFPGGPIVLDHLTFAAAPQHRRLAIHAPIVDMFHEGETIGTLYAVFDWQQVVRILDDIEDETAINDEGRRAVLLDRDGVIIAASSVLQEQGVSLSSSWAAWPPVRSGQSGATTTDGRLFGEGTVLVGYAHSRGYLRFAGFGWSTIVVQPTRQAFVPIRRMALAFGILLALTGVFAVGASLAIASRLARPIVALTTFTRQLAGGKSLQLPPPVGMGEVGELTTAFVQMVHDLEQSREELIRAAKLAVIGEMAASLAHEVRTPLGIIRSSAQMIQREPHLSSDGREMVSFVITETDRLNRLISTLLNLARPRPPVFQMDNIHEILRHAVALLTQRVANRNLQLSEEYLALSPELVCDREQLLQVFLNLLLNAIQMVPEGGKIVVHTANVGDQLLIDMADSGPGITPDNRERIFDPFVTTRIDGIGLGLTIVKQIVHTHGGSITMIDTPLGGACFRILLPQIRSVATDDETACVSR